LSNPDFGSSLDHPTKAKESLISTRQLSAAGTGITSNSLPAAKLRLVPVGRSDSFRFMTDGCRGMTARHG
jgi:hypothetical protein